MPRKQSTTVLLFALVLAPVTITLTWKAKSLEKKLFGRSDEARLMNKQAPEFRLMTLTGEQISSTDYRGKKKLVVSFWASWCGPCRMELPELQAFYEKYHASSGFEILAISTDEDPHEAERYVKEAKLTFPILWDQDGKAGEAYAVEGIPMLFVIDESGKIIRAQAGYGFGLEFRLAESLGIQPNLKGAGNKDADTSD